MAKKLLVYFERYRDQTTLPSRLVSRTLIIWEKFRTVKLSRRLRVFLENAGSGKIKVGFGPLLERENTLGYRKWGIDPVIDGINAQNKRYVADFFHGDEDLSRFDIIVLVKNFETVSEQQLSNLRSLQKKLIYNPRDNPQGCVKSYLDNDWVVSAMNGIITSNPVQSGDFETRCSNVRMIGTPIINTEYIRRYEDKKKLTLIWQGYLTNAGFMEKLHPVIEAINSESETKLSLIYHCDRRPAFIDGDIFRFVQWKAGNWQALLSHSDIGIVIKPEDDRTQQSKPPTKILSYMAAGLPVICTPSAADKLVIQHGVTGFFAYTDEDWYQYLRQLIQNRELRESMGKAAREFAIENYSQEKIATEYTSFFDELLTFHP